MAFTNTTYLNLIKPNYDDEEDKWGDHLNSNFDIIDTAINDNTNRLNNILTTFETEWIPRSEWRNVHLGSNTTKNLDSNVEHLLNAPVWDLKVRLLISLSGDDTDVIIPNDSIISGGYSYGYIIFHVDNDNFLIQTGNAGISYIQNSDGQFSNNPIDSDDIHYKIKAFKIV